jgi:hypothetical protein
MCQMKPWKCSDNSALLRCEVLHTRKGRERERERRANKQEITTSPA